jgi:hypothetical protein
VPSLQPPEPDDCFPHALRVAGERYRLALLWLHSFEEPFYTAEQMQALAAASRFGRGDTHYVGGLCCLAMMKPPLGTPGVES